MVALEHLKHFIRQAVLALFFQKKDTEPKQIFLLTRIKFYGKMRHMKNAPHMLDVIEEIILTSLYTSQVKESVPVSIVLIADSGTAKSKLLQSLHGKSIHQTDSFSSNGLFEIMAKDTDGVVRWIVTPDLNPTLSRRPATVVATVANLLTLTMDGTCRIDDGRDDKKCKHEPIGLLSAMTPDVYAKQAKKWLSLGLRRRIIPIFYEYTMETLEELKKLLRQDSIDGSSFPPIYFQPKSKYKPPITETTAFRIESLGTVFSSNLGLQKFKGPEGRIKWYVKNIVPISPIITLRTLARAHALMKNRTAITEEDLLFLVRFVECTNQSQPRKI